MQQEHTNTSALHHGTCAEMRAPKMAMTVVFFQFRFSFFVFRFSFFIILHFFPDLFHLGHLERYAQRKRSLKSGWMGAGLGTW